MKYFYLFALFLALLTSLSPSPALAETERGTLGPDNCLLGLADCGDVEIRATTREDYPETVPTIKGQIVPTETCWLFFTCEKGTQNLTQFSEVDSNGNLSGRSIGGGNLVGGDDGIAAYIIKIIAFINFAIIPLLFGIALLFFLINIVRYFIIDTSSADSREKAKRSALYGIAAFVFLVSIWGIVNLFVSGLEFDQQDSICPDYLGSWCGNQSFSGNTRSGSGQGIFPPFSNRVNTPTDGSTPALVDFGCGSGVDEDDCVQYSGLAELLYGPDADQTALSFNPGNPRNQGNTPQIASNASCAAGVNTLRQAANIETNQAVYAFYTTASGQTAWTNLTDDNRNNRLVIDADTINQIEANGATDVRIVQMQPKSIASTVELPLDGYGPSAADYSVQCDNILRDFPFITVDWNGVWKSENESRLACPRRTSDTEDLILIDALYAVSMLPAGSRNEEFQKLLNSDLVPNDDRADLTGFANGNLDNMSPEQIRNLANSIESDVKIMSNRVTTTEACQITTSIAAPTPPPVAPQTTEELVRTAVATGIGADPAVVSTVNFRAVTWNDGCLGLAEAGDICTMATVPGFEIILNVGGEQRTFHTNSNGSIFRENR